MRGGIWGPEGPPTNKILSERVEGGARRPPIKKRPFLGRWEWGPGGPWAPYKKRPFWGGWEVEIYRKANNYEKINK